ncbi:MAG: pili assembly chaperone [Gammaproteobacteria bacterium]|nr:pili assembly chaperone [Gammaproteobacteria bacterium]
MDMNRHSPFPSLPRQQIALALAMLITFNVACADEVQVGRYATVQAVPTSAQVHLLSAMVRVQFSASVVSVGQAVDHLLQPSGYRLASETAADPSRRTLLNLPLPEPHRTLGPMPLQTALETLAGPAYRLVEDPVHRLVSFERCGPGQYGTVAETR